MIESELTGKAQTVLGIIESKELGVTLPHEHLLSDAKVNFVEPSEASGKGLAYKPVSLEILSWIYYHPLENLDNVRLLDEQEAIDEAMLFKKAGGNTIVDMTNVGIGRDPEGLAHISRATGLNIIMGSGYYVEASHPPDMSAKTEEMITEEIVRDIKVGVGETGIRAGIIGEIGCTWPLLDNERKVLCAAARAQQLTGAPLSIHMGRKKESALEIVEILDDANADLSRTAIAHADSRIRDHQERCKVAEKGCYLEYDLFGAEGHISLYDYWKDDLFYQPNDPQRVYEIKQLIDEGYLNQILISHDVWMKIWRVRYGGKGYTHISNHVIPKMLRVGMTSEQINTIMVENPKRFLCFV